MLLSDMGADVVTVDRPGKPLGDPTNIVGRGRTVIMADLKNAAARDEVLHLLDQADVLIEGFRPGVMERLGLGPTVVSARNPRLIYGRMTGWGQSGPLAQTAGHDINYIALSGALHAIGPAGGPPVPPLNLVGDYGGGSLYLVVGILAALHEVRRSGQGQVVDAAIIDGTLSLMSQYLASSMGAGFVDQRGSNLFNGGLPYYGVYETADAKFISIGPIEPQFFSRLCDRLGVERSLHDAQHDRSRQSGLRAELERIFRQRSRDEWTAELDGSDFCFAPVLAISEAGAHPHNVARRAFVDVDGTQHPAPAPRFSRTASSVQGPAPSQALEIQAVVARWLAKDPI